jgi:hypothetical protein
MQRISKLEQKAEESTLDGLYKWLYEKKRLMRPFEAFED